MQRAERPRAASKASATPSAAVLLCTAKKTTCPLSAMEATLWGQARAWACRPSCEPPRHISARRTDGHVLRLHRISTLAGHQQPDPIPGP
jgi:hypothetical protein